VDYIRKEHGYSLTRACGLIDLSRSQYYYQSTKDDTTVREKVSQLAERFPTEGQDKIYWRIRNEGLPWNHKRIRRIYKQLLLDKRIRKRKRLASRVKVPLEQPLQANHCWSMDFMHDTLASGRKFRVLNIIDDFNREALRIEPHFSIGSSRVVSILERLTFERGKPSVIRVDNGPEFIAGALNEWCSENNIRLQFIQPGKPNQNAYIERFNRSFRERVLDAWLFDDLSQVRILSDEFMEDYNHHRPHEALGNVSPLKYMVK
jgi:putative transposase